MKKLAARLFVTVVLGLGMVIVGVLFPWVIARAATCNVPSGYATIQAAIDDPACDTVVIAAGDYTENLVITRSVTLQGAGPGWSAGPNVTRIRGGSADRVVNIPFTINTPPTVNISDLTIMEGYTTDSGGGIYNGKGILYLTNVYMFQNYAVSGSQLYNHVMSVATIENSYFLLDVTVPDSIQSSGSLTIINSTIEDALAGSRGIFTAGSLVVRDSEIRGFGDEAIYVYRGVITVENSIIHNNGQGISFFDGTAGTISNSQIVSQTAQPSLGGNASFAGIGLGGQVTVTIDSSVIGNGLALGNTDYMHGIDMASVYGKLGVLTVTNSTIYQNENAGINVLAEIGGASGGDITIINTQIYSNTSGISMSSISEDSGNAVTILDSNIRDNSGVGVRLDRYGKTFRLERSDVRDNGGAGVALEMSTQAVSALIQDTTIAYNGGTGLHLYDADAAVEVNRSTIMFNTAAGSGIGSSPTSSGGGVHAARGSYVRLANSTIAQNDANENGGGIFVDDSSSVELINVTLARNTADIDNDGNGLSGGYYVTAGGVLTLTNTLAAANNLVSAGNPYDCSGAIVSGGTNLVRVADTGCSGFVASDLTGTTASPLNAGLGPLQDNGGATWTISISVNSPAADAGQNSVCNAAPINGKDQREYGRVNEDGNNDSGADGNPCDIGAYERSGTPPTPTPTNT
ncbi:MAG TPA: hypothetical protein ENK32_08105, partial [Anaerolineae bacterium]|nr:hypothetical protein [Anaerolineae bacterium]